MSKRKHLSYGRSVIKKPKTFNPWNGASLSSAEAEVTDAMSAIEFIRKLFPQKEIGDRFPPIIFKHQLYTLLENRTDVDKQVNSLIECGRIKMFQLEHRHEEYIIILMTDFVSYVHRFHNIPVDGFDKDSKNTKKLNASQQVISRFLVEVLSSVHDLWVSENTLLKKYGFKDKDITELVNAGLLTLHDAGSWWFSTPGAGQFVKLFKKGRQATLRMIRSTKHKEILLYELKSRKSPASMKFGLLYHIHDLVGSDLIKCIPSTSGLVLRIIDRTMMCKTICLLLLQFLNLVSTNAWPCSLCSEEFKDSKHCSAGHGNYSNEDVSWLPFVNSISSSSVDIALDSAGMHNSVRTIVKVELSSSEFIEDMETDCIILYVQNVPNSFFIDQYEVKRLHQNRGFLSLFNENIDVELPQYLAQNETVLFYSALKRLEENILVSKLDIPWHSRYHRCSTEEDSNQTHTHAMIPAPDIFASCLNNVDIVEPRLFHTNEKRNICDTSKRFVLAPCMNLDDNKLLLKDSPCLWMQIADSEDILSIAIPVGLCSHGTFVKGITLAVTWLGTIAIAYHSFKRAIS